MAKDNSISAALQKTTAILEKLDDQARCRVLRAINAAFDQSESGTGDKEQRKERVENNGTGAGGKMAPAVTMWIRKSGLTTEHLEQVFHIEEGKVSTIADSVPGESKKEMTVNCYMLEGVRAFLESGNAMFTEAAAEASCEHYGCKDATNHAKYRKSAGNKMRGSKSAGWTLVAPGLTFAASLVKGIATADSAIKS